MERLLAMNGGTEIMKRAGFETIRYAQCWEDAALLTRWLQPSGRDCLSIGSAGDNSFALLAADAASVTAVEMNPAQLACIELRRAAYLRLDHHEFLELLGSRQSDRRTGLYRSCRTETDRETQAFWDSRLTLIERGIGGIGKFENYFRIFREVALPLVHPRRTVKALLDPRSPAERRRFYDEIWNNRRWRWMFRLFFSRRIMGALGRDAEFFHYAEGSVAVGILGRTEHALATLDPSQNPYLHWILTGTHGAVLPPALEESGFEKIRVAIANRRFRAVKGTIEDWIDREPDRRYGAMNLSDIFEYMSMDSYESLLRRLVTACEPGARLAYWNMQVPRSRPDSMAKLLLPLESEAATAFAADRAFFYRRFVLEEVVT